ncbi:MAG: TetR/AcrR family transcriptional regulator C-terminal domain-containing protein [Chloroflexota bacterium]
MTGAVKPHRGLTTDRVVDAALRLADEGGLGALSVRRLAADLGVTPMAIYRHVHDKNHLLDLMADRLIGRLDLGPLGAATWQERLRRLASNLLAMLEAHPAAPFLLSRPFESAAALRVSEAWFGILHSAGFDTGQSVRLLQVVTGMVLGPAIHRATYAAAWRDRPREAAGTAPGRGELQPGDFPYLSEAADQLMDWSPGSDADRVTIELLVSGLEALASRPTRGSQQ